MIIYDMEVFKHDWMIVYLDTKTRTLNHIINSNEELMDFYNRYKTDIFVGYNSRNYDQWVVKAILCDFNPYDMNTWIIDKDRKGHEFSQLLSKFPIMNYDCSVGFFSLKQCEAFMGHEIKESSVPFDIDRPLTDDELQEVLKYCQHDVMETFEVFVETKHEFESHIQLISEFGLPMSDVSKTKAQLSSKILGATMKKHDDEFDITFPSTMDLGKYSDIKDWYKDWSDNSKDYQKTLETKVMGAKHTFAFGGLHGALESYHGEGYFLMADVASYYPALMIEYGLLSRNISNPKKYTMIRDERIRMKAVKDPRQAPRKIVLNSTFGALKDKYNALFDPLQSNNVCIYGQLLLVDLLDKLEGHCQLIQTNTDGILVKLHSPSDKSKIISICDTWAKRVRMELEYEVVKKVFQKDVNNYVIVSEDGKVKSKGAFVKELNNLDNNLPIVNRAVKNYLVKGIPVETSFPGTRTP